MGGQIQRDWLIIKDTEWWHWVRSEIEGLRDNNINRLIGESDHDNICVLQGKIRVLSQLLNIIEKVETEED